MGIKIWTLRWEEKSEGEARQKRPGKANLAQDQAGVEQDVGPSPAPKDWFSTHVGWGIMGVQDSEVKHSEI